MANINLRRDTNPTPSASQIVPNDPYRMMRDMLSWDPFRDISTFSPLSNLNVFPQVAIFSPDFEVKETKDTYQIKATKACYMLRTMCKQGRLTQTGCRVESGARLKVYLVNP